MSDGKEHRSHTQLRKYWDSLRKNRPFPRESDIDPDAIADIWPSCFLVSIDAVTRRLGVYRYSYLGEKIIEAYGDNGSDSDVASYMMSATDIPMIEKFDEVRDTKKPVIDEAEFINKRHLKVKYRTCLLPLGHTENEVSHIIGCMRWKVC